MPPRIPWMTSSPMRRKRTPAMAVSLPLELEGEGGASGGWSQLWPTLNTGCSPPRNRFSTSSGDGPGTSTLISSASPLFINMY